MSAFLGPAAGSAPDDPLAAEQNPVVQQRWEKLGPANGDSAAVDSGRVVMPVNGAAASIQAEPWHREPKYIMMRSLVLPGWGQLANRRPWKALLVAAGEGFFIYRAFHYGREELDLRREAGKHPEGSFERTDLRRKAAYAGDRRRDSVWWAIFSMVLSMGDAYVDAHLGRGFDAEFEPQDRETPTGRRELGFHIGIRRRFN